MSFREPLLLWLLVAVPFALAFLASREKRRQQIARRLVSERVRGLSNGIRPLRPPLLAAGLALAIVALAGPRFGSTVVPVEERQSNRILVMDVSDSMLAEDVGLSRWSAAKSIARRLIRAQPGRMALVIFESSPQTVSPFTTDGEAVISLLDSIEPGETDDPGSDLGAALTAAEKLAEADAGQKTDIVLISDGEDQGSHLEAALTRARNDGIPVHTVVLGSEQGANIPIQGGPLRDESGQIVVTSSHPETMRHIASATGGEAVLNPASPASLAALGAGPTAGGAAKVNWLHIPIERFQWPLAGAIAFLLLGSIAHRGAE